MAANNSFKPNLLRYGNGVAEEACHAVASTAQVGLTQALGPYETTMDAKQFVANWRAEKERYLQHVMEPGTFPAKQIASMQLSEFQTHQLGKLLDIVLTDVMYTLLLGLDGCASIGGDQQIYKILDEDGNVVSSCGDIEVEAYEQFHGGA